MAKSKKPWILTKRRSASLKRAQQVHKLYVAAGKKILAKKLVENYFVAGGYIAMMEG